MHYCRTLPLLAFVALLSLLLPVTSGAETRTLERIVAIVNDRVILASDLEEEVALVRQQIQQQGQQPPPAAALRERVLDQLVNESLQLQHARRMGISVSDDMVNRALEQIARENNTDLTGLREHFSRQGIEFSTVREDIRTQLILQQLQQRAVASRITIAEQDIEDFIARLDEADDEEVEYRVQHILISASSSAGDDEIEQARAQAEQAAAELREGGDFARMAAEISAGPQATEGGDLGWRAPDQLPSLFLEAIEGLRPGQIADPVESARGFHILLLAERRGGMDQAVAETRARHILIRADDDGEMQDSEARQRITQLRERLDGGASFDNLARGHSEDPGSASEGGDLGWFGPGEMTPAFQEVVDDLEVGATSEPFRTEFGWHIVEVLDRREIQDQGQRQRAQARQVLFRERVEEETQRWIRELREEAFVDKRLDDAPSGS